MTGPETGTGTGTGTSAEGFDAEWLALREPVDHASRSEAALDALLGWRDDRGPITVRDLGSGTGSNLRFLAPALGGDQTWLLVDNDPVLLGAATERLSDWAARNDVRAKIQGDGLVLSGKTWRAEITTSVCDLNRSPTGPNIAATGGRAPDLITGAALLDLVSLDWLRSFTDRVRQMRAAVHFTLSYDGVMTFDPDDPADSLILNGFNTDQSRDKGLGRAMGPQGAETLAGLLDRAGYEVTTGNSPWRLGPGNGALGLELVTGVTNAAADAMPGHRDRLTGWLDIWRRRLQTPEDIASWGITIGHLDLTALP